MLRNVISSVTPLVNCEILADTSLKFVRDGMDTILKRISSPLIMEYGEVINSNGFWTKNNLIFAYDKDYYVYSPELHAKNQVYQGWNNLGDKYFAFRETMLNDTIYGWFSVSIQNYAIFVHSYAKL
ncbi:MAG: hypothetical protein JXB49_26115 [Bacteroidales bacterium]|nr:hypothetical protein [Bacteroidales bacterium]